MVTCVADYKGTASIQIPTRQDLLVVANAETVAECQEPFCLQPRTPYTTYLYHSTATSNLGLKKGPCQLCYLQ